MRPDKTPFLTSWVGIGLPEVRPSNGTYGRFPLEELPPLPFELRGDFAWLLRVPQRANPLDPEWLKLPADDLDPDQRLAAGLLRSFKAHSDTRRRQLRDDAVSREMIFPPGFEPYFYGPNLAGRLRSCSGCEFRISPQYVPSPKGEGLLLPFFQDYQGCAYWYIYQLPQTADHCVVTSPHDFLRDDQEPSGELSEIYYCEHSFEAFLCRFWLENEIWYSHYDKTPLLPECKTYLDWYLK